MSEASFPSLLSKLFLAASLAAGPHVSAQTSQPPANKTAQTAEALASPLSCGGKLIDELQRHVTGVRCMTYYDHSCNWAYITGATMASGAIASSSNIYATLRQRSAEKALTIAKDGVMKEAQAAGKTAFSESFEKALTSQAAVMNGKYLTAEQARVHALRSLETLATQEGLQTAKVRAATIAAGRLAVVPTIRMGGLVASGAAVATGPIGTGILILLESVSPAGEKCNDNGMAFIDQRITEDGKNCEYSFELNGPKFRSFFNQTRETQLRVLKNDKSVCEYMNLFNEALKGNLLSELQMLNQVRFTSLPSCKAIGGGGVDYEIEHGERKYRVKSTHDEATKTKVRTLNMAQLLNGNEFGATTVKFIDEADGSKPYQVVVHHATGNHVTKSYSAFLTSVSYNRNAESAVKLMNLSQFWTPVAASCCHEFQKDTDRENCWRDKLPGLKLEQIEAEKKEGSTESGTAGQL